MIKRSGITVEDFQRAVDEFFDEMLISRWRRSVEPDEFERGQVLDHLDRYEVRVVMRGVNPEKIQVEVSGQRLCVRAPSEREGVLESAYSFSTPIEQDAVEARCSEDILIVTLPKQKPKRIKVNE